MLIFGHYGFPIKTIKPGAAHPEVESIQLVVRVFHFFYIPLFPYTKIWTVNKGGKRFKIEGSSLVECEQLYGNQAYPFYTFAGIILIALVPVAIAANGIVKKAQQQQFAKEEMFKQQVLLSVQLKAMAIDDILIFQNTQQQFLLGQVIQSNGEHVQLKMGKELLPDLLLNNYSQLNQFLNKNTDHHKIELAVIELSQSIDQIYNPQAHQSFLAQSQLNLFQIKKRVD